MIQISRSILLKSALLLCLLFNVIPSYSVPRIVIDKSELQGKNEVELYRHLRRRHQEAFDKGAELIYPANVVLKISIPANTSPMPLSSYTDFNGCKIIVENKSIRKFTLFSLAAKVKETPVKVSCRMINRGDFTSIPQLSSGLKLLRIKDLNAWTHRDPDEGDYDVFRQDIVLIKNGKATNSTTTTYEEDTSNPECLFLDVDDRQKVVCNLTVERTASSTEHTRVLQISSQNNVLVKNVKVTTPFVPQDTDNKLYKEDNCFRVVNSANIRFEDVQVRGTYSSAKTWGYAVNMENVYNTQFLRFDAEAHWGVFGNNNVNTVTLTDCRINRYDLHCYGRDVTCKRCVFSNKIDNSHPNQIYCPSSVLNAFGSMFGTLSFEDCHFVQSKPVWLRPHYKAYTPFDIVFRKCTFDILPDFPYIVATGFLDEGDNPRRELKDKCWPNVSMRDCQVNVPDKMKVLYMFFVRRQDRKVVAEIDHLSSIDLRNVKITSPSSASPTFKASNAAVKLTKRLKTKTKRTSLRLDTNMLGK